METRNGVKLSPIERVATYEIIVRQIQEEIFSGRLQAGDKLPGERQLSEMLGVSRASVREAMRVLEALGVVRVRRGTGLDSGATIVDEPAGILGSLLRLHVALSHFPVRDVVETRVHIESWAAALAAHNVTDVQAENLQRLLHEMDEPGIGPDEFHRLDTAFHLELADASGNQLASYLMHAIREAISAEMRAVFEQVDDWEQTVRGMRAAHRRIFDAVRSRNPEKASSVVREHIEEFAPRLAEIGHIARVSRE